MPSRPFCLISFLSLEDVPLDCQSKTKLTQPAKNCKIYFNKVKLDNPLTMEVQKNTPPKGIGDLISILPIFTMLTFRRTPRRKALVTFMEKKKV